MLSKHCWIAIH